MKPSAILTALQTALKNNSALSYVDDTHIFIGKRSNIQSFPAIAIDPILDKKMRDEYPDELRSLSIAVLCAINVFNEDKQLVGTSDLPGVADFLEHVKIALSADHTLGGASINVTIGDGAFDSYEFYPLRNFQITVEVLYRQNRLTRE